jgi:drug/metabolite transporter (DMT)-like permease
VSLWLNLETPATALLAVVFFREHVGWRMWWAIALVSAASIVLLWPAGFAAASAAALVALACVCWGIDNNLTALIDGFTLTQSTFVKGVAAGTLNLALGLWFEPNIWRAPTLTTALFVGALSYGLSLVLHIAGAQHLGAARAQTVFGTAPFWGVALSWIMLGEPRAPEQVLAGGLMIVALWVMRTEQHGHTHTHIAAAHTHWHRHDDGHHEHTHPELAPGSWHSHEHAHEAGTHEHDHAPDLHHRHGH